MSRNTWIIIIVAALVVIGLTWTFNRAASDIDRSRPTVICLSSVQNEGQTYCTSSVYGYPMSAPSSGEGHPQ